LQRFLELFEGVDAASVRAARAEELAALPLWERLKRRIVDGELDGLNADLDEALAQRPALEIVNDVLLDGMKVVGDLFGSGQMQLPFVLQSAEVMKTAVAYLEPHMEKSADGGKGRIVLATVKGDEHDIAELFEGEVRYARDAFEGLRLMDALMAVKRGEEGAKLPPLRRRRVRSGAKLKVTEPEDMPARSDVATDNELPTPPFTGD